MRSLIKKSALERALKLGANKLQNAKLIRYARGRITVLDRKGLEHRVCECYEVVKTEYSRLLPMELAA